MCYSALSELGGICVVHLPRTALGSEVPSLAAGLDCVGLSGLLFSIGFKDFLCASAPLRLIPGYVVCKR